MTVATGPSMVQQFQQAHIYQPPVFTPHVPLIPPATPPAGMPLPPAPGATPAHPAHVPPAHNTLPAPAAHAAGAVTPGSASGALGTFANSAGMQFAQQQSADAVNNLYAAHGQLQSGAAAKAIQDRSTQIALQDYFMPYMNYLTGQQAMGAQSAANIGGMASSYGNTVNGLGQNYSNAATGLGQNFSSGIGASGQNYANAATGINGNMGNALSSGAINIGNANANGAIIGGLANAGVGSAIGAGIGSIASSFVPPAGAASVPYSGGGYNTGGGTNNYFASNPFGGSY